MKLVRRDRNEGSDGVDFKLIEATWEPCRPHFMRNAVDRAGKTQRCMVRAAIGTVFVKDSADAATTQGRAVENQLCAEFPKLGALTDEVENNVLASRTLPAAHSAQIHRPERLKRLNAEIKRRTDVVSIVNDASIVRLVRAKMLEQNDGWCLSKR